MIFDPDDGHGRREEGQGRAEGGLLPSVKRGEGLMMGDNLQHNYGDYEYVNLLCYENYKTVILKAGMAITQMVQSPNAQSSDRLLGMMQRSPWGERSRER